MLGRCKRTLTKAERKKKIGPSFICSITLLFFFSFFLAKDYGKEEEEPWKYRRNALLSLLGYRSKKYLLITETTAKKKKWGLLAGELIHE